MLKVIKTEMRLRLFLAIAWLIVATVLFCLPGSALPSSGWMAAVRFDLWVHVGIFSLLCFFWGNVWRTQNGVQHRNLFIAAVAYGLMIELMQHYLIINRSFDIWDLVADAVGAFVGLWVLRYIKR